MCSEVEKLAQIEGVVSKEYHVMLDEFCNSKDWCYEPKIIHKKKHSTVKMFVQFIVNINAHDLHKIQEEICAKHTIKITAKDTDLEYIKRLGHIIRPSMKLASPATHAKKINNTACLQHRKIKIKKQIIF